MQEESQQGTAKDPKEEEKRESLKRCSVVSKLWFERLSAKLKTPLFLGILIIGFVPAIALWSLGISIRIRTDFTEDPITSLLLIVLNVTFLLVSSNFICRRVESLRQYTDTLGTGVASRNLNRLYSLRAIIIIWAILVLASGLLFDPVIFKLYYSFNQSLLRVVVTSFIRFVQATFLWVFGYSMYSIYRWGKLPMKLKSFVDDPTLGLGMYGKASLFFVTLYIAAVLLTFPIFVYPGDAVVVSQAIFLSLGLGLFLSPLLGLRKRLLVAKQQKLAWIRGRHSRVMEMIESKGESPLESSLVNELIAVENIRRDLQQIRTWPFNASVLAKMVTAAVLPLVVSISANYLINLLRL
ncbi:hypothetical protein MUP77_16535 [Candidatus Bathyarchaeota archaeon]|nr:hypothetical protein [Candidatus Bathyarchaeota archaeon]